MTKAEMHYLNCTNTDCELFACVARRDYERKLSRSERVAPAVTVPVGVLEAAEALMNDHMIGRLLNFQATIVPGSTIEKMRALKWALKSFKASETKKGS